MKTIRLFLGIIAIVFAFASAFAFKTSSSVVEPSFIDTSGPVAVCRKESATCSGTSQDCVVSSKTRYDFANDSDCGPVLKMQ